MELSKEQQEAVENVNGQVILISCPGSGKTSTIIRRVSHMVEVGIPPHQILVLTFSRDAAAEMETRYRQFKYAETRQDVVFSTIHSFCFQVVAAAYQMGSENILRDSDAWMIVRRGLDDLRRTGNIKMQIRDYADFTSSCIREISVINNNCMDDVVKWDNYDAQTCPTKEFRMVYELYERQKRSMGKIDYDDMLRLCYRLFRDQPDILEEYQRRYRYIIVDEYQDTNYIQASIIYMLAGKEKDANICIVGDDDQSIYRFRGARPEIMLNFPDTYPNCRRIYMETNFRSEPEIINAAKKLIAHNKKRFPKDIRPHKKGHGTLEVFNGKNARDEVFQLIGKLEKYHNDGIDYTDMAVLYRNNKQAGFLAVALMGREIPFYSSERISSPYSHWIFSDIMAFYRLAEGIGTNQDLIQVINKPNRFIPTNCLRKCPISRKAVLDAVRMEIGENWKWNKAEYSIQSFFQNLKYLKGVDPEDFLDILNTFTGYVAYLEEYARYRQQDPSELTNILALYAEDIKSQGITSMEQWTDYARQMNASVNEMNQNRSKQGVFISTMHRSKGLEWDNVFIMGANDNIIPSPYAKDVEAVEEERRLFYVAATRARKRLCISWAETLGDEGKRSRFVDEIFDSAFLAQSSKDVPSKRIKFKKRDKVFHEKYGKGVVIQTTGEEIIVKFDNKTVLCKFCNCSKELTII